MNLESLQDIWAAAVAASETITAWCSANNYRAHTVVKTTNLEDLPQESQFPLVAFNIGRKKAGLAEENETLEISVTVGLFDESAPVVTGNIVELVARARCEELRRLVVTVIGASDMEGGYIGSVETEHEPVEITGFYLCSMAITVMRPYQWRENKIL